MQRIESYRPDIDSKVPKGKLRVNVEISAGQMAQNFLKFSKITPYPREESHPLSLSTRHGINLPFTIGDGRKIRCEPLLADDRVDIAPIDDIGMDDLETQATVRRHGRSIVALYIQLDHACPLL